MSNRKTFGERLGGIQKSDRIEAKLLMLAFAPMLPLMITDELGWPRNLFWNIWACFCAFWFLSITIIGFIPYWKHLGRYFKRKR